MSGGLSLRARLERLAHLWKATTQQHHRDLLPLLRPLLPPDGVAIDIGAHAGQFTKLFAALAPAGRIVSIEPSPYARSILTTVVRLHRLRNVTVVAAGLSDQPGERVLATPIKRSGAVGFGLASFAATGGEGVRREDRVAVETLDGLVGRLTLPRVDLVKCDVEGWEAHVLRGAIATMARFRPALLVEVVASSLARAGESPAGIWSLLAPLGYAAQRLPEGAKVEGFAGDGDYLFRPIR
ncbi:MAG: FkbM family methyltransferase [Acetobacteraceae bacterium]|nr:FkbM family methyltransferase [Acetobacteraceae bacterium]